MKVVITCGPSFEPIDGARRLTNMSTGRLGVTLANALTVAGHEVICLKGEGATCCEPIATERVEGFSTNDDLACRLEDISRRDSIDAVLHAAALCDYRVEEVRDGAGQPITSAKFATRDGRLHLVLAPATKVLPKLRKWFPNARLVGWKYELNGSRDEAIDKARRQISECRTDGCVLNGAAYGPGFAFCLPDGRLEACADAKELGLLLNNWLRDPLPNVSRKRPTG